MSSARFTNSSPSTANYPPIIDLSILKNGPQKENNQVIKKFRCEEVSGGSSTVPDGACDKITQVEVGADFKGVVGYVSKMFFGQPNGMAGGSQPGSIIQKVFYCTDSATASCGLTAEQRYFLASVRGPAVRLLMATIKEPGLAQKVMDDLTPVIANDYYMQYLNLFEQAARLAYTGEGQQPTPEFAKDVIKQLHDLKILAQTENEEHVRKMNEIAR